MQLLIRGVTPSPMSLADSRDIRFPNSVIGQVVYLRRGQRASAFSQYNAGTERWFYRAGLLATAARTVEDGRAPATGRADK
jgi:hypothetical protein